jgi:hypothetical protein
MGILTAPERELPNFQFARGSLPLLLKKISIYTIYYILYKQILY